MTSRTNVEARQTSAPPRLSVIIPTWNEAVRLPVCLRSVPATFEVIVSDGGSDDDTCKIATEWGARLVTGDRGRAPQLNLGARAASGDVLLFLHADCVLGASAEQAVATALEDSRVVGGSFRMVIEPATMGLRLVSTVSNARARYLQMPYGDQAIFIRRSAFEALGGFPDLPLMEDVGLIRRLRRRGRIVQVDEPVTTGAEHWAQLGVVGTTLLNWATAVAFLAGVPAKKLAPFYTRLRTPTKAKTPPTPAPQRLS